MGLLFDDIEQLDWNSILNIAWMDIEDSKGGKEEMLPCNSIGIPLQLLGRQQPDKQ
jgi:hypothetical protein